MQLRGTAEGGDTPAAAPVAPASGFSLLRASVPMRLGLAAVAACLLWLSVIWALT